MWEAVEVDDVPRPPSLQTDSSHQIYHFASVKITLKNTPLPMSNGLTTICHPAKGSLNVETAGLHSRQVYMVDLVASLTDTYQPSLIPHSIN